MSTSFSNLSAIIENALFVSALNKGEEDVADASVLSFICFVTSDKSILTESNFFFKSSHFFSKSALAVFLISEIP